MLSDESVVLIAGVITVFVIAWSIWRRRRVTPAAASSTTSNDSAASTKPNGSATSTKSDGPAAFTKSNETAASTDPPNNAPSDQDKRERPPTDYDDGPPDDDDGFRLATIIFTPHSLTELRYEHNESQHLYEGLLRSSAEAWKHRDGRIKFDNLLRVIDFLIDEDKDIGRNIGYEIIAKAGCRDPISPLQAAQVLAALSVSDKLELVSPSSPRGKRYLQLLRSFIGHSKFGRKNTPRNFFLSAEPNLRYRQAAPGSPAP